MNGMMVAGRTGGSSRWYWWKSQSLVLELAEVVVESQAKHVKVVGVVVVDMVGELFSLEQAGFWSCNWGWQKLQSLVILRSERLDSSSRVVTVVEDEGDEEQDHDIDEGEQQQLGQ